MTGRSLRRVNELYIEVIKISFTLINLFFQLTELNANRAAFGALTGANNAND